jgi:hypothetical protein
MIILVCVLIAGILVAVPVAYELGRKHGARKLDAEKNSEKEG